MTPDLTQYIETQILPTAGKVKPGKRFTNLANFVMWVDKNLKYQATISAEHLSTFLMTEKPFIAKKRNIYVNLIDFDKIDAELIGNDHIVGHKLIFFVIVLPCEFVPVAEFWFMTDDEFEIWKAVRNG